MMKVIAIRHPADIEAAYEMLDALAQHPDLLNDVMPDEKDQEGFYVALAALGVLGREAERSAAFEGNLAHLETLMPLLKQKTGDPS